MSRRHYKVSGGGVLPAGYAECEWIGVAKETKHMFIDTEYRPDNETGICFEFSNFVRSNADLNFFGCKNNQTDNARFMINVNYGSIGFGFNSYKKLSQVDFIQKHRVLMNYLNDRMFNVDDGIVSSSITDTLPYMVNNIGIFTSIQSYDYASLGCNVYNTHLVEITQGNNVVRRFIPCVRLSDMQAGMYELFGNVCSLTNTPFFSKIGGTGSFTYQLKS